MTPHKTFPSLRVEEGGGGRSPLGTHKPEILSFKSHDVLVWNVWCIPFSNKITYVRLTVCGPPTNKQPAGVIIMPHCGRGLFYSCSFYSAVVYTNYKAQTQCYHNLKINLIPPPIREQFSWTSNISIRRLLTGRVSLRYWTLNRNISSNSDHLKGKNNSRSLREK